jgi:hypothetical protein
MTAARKSRNLHSLERLSRVMALTALALALMGGIAAPLLALSWSHQPFPGFLVEQTLVVNGIKGDGWGRQPADPDYPQRVTRLGGTAVAKPADFTAVIREQAAGQQVSILTELPDGSARLFPSVTLTDFPPADMVRLFWLPYLVGLVYLGIGIWIYRARGNTAPGRSLAYLCANIAIVCILFFDLSTTHVAPAVWTAALAQIGGALIGLALRFPEPTDEVQLRSTTGHRASHLYTLFAGQRAWLRAHRLGHPCRPQHFAALGLCRSLGCQLSIYRLWDSCVSWGDAIPGSCRRITSCSTAGTRGILGERAGIHACDPLVRRSAP